MQTVYSTLAEKGHSPRDYSSDWESSCLDERGGVFMPQQSKQILHPILRSSGDHCDMGVAHIATAMHIYASDDRSEMRRVANTGGTESLFADC